MQEEKKTIVNKLKKYIYKHSRYTSSALLREYKHNLFGYIKRAVQSILDI